MRTTIVGAGVVGLMAAAKNLGSAPVPKPPAADPASTTPPAVNLARDDSGNVVLTSALNGIENDFTKKQNWVSLETYLAQPKINVINNNPQNNAAIEQALITLKANMAKGGMASTKQEVQGATRESIERIAELTGIDKKEFVNAYTNARDAVNNDAHTQAVYHEKMGKALDALSEKITASRSSEGATVTFSGGHGGGGGNETLIASADTGGIASDVPMGILPAQHQNPLATMMHGAVSRLEGVAHNVAVVAQHPAAQAAMKTLGVVGVAASVAATVHAARSGHTALAVMNGATAVATAAATVGMPPLAAFAGGVRVAAFVKDRSDEKTLGRVKDQKAALMTKRETLLQEPQTLATKAKIVMTNLALVTKTADVFAARKLNQGREGLAQTFENAQTITQTTMETATNAFQSAQERTATMFATLFNRQTTAAL